MFFERGGCQRERLLDIGGEKPPEAFLASMRVKRGFHDTTAYGDGAIRVYVYGAVKGLILSGAPCVNDRIMDG